MLPSVSLQYASQPMLESAFLGRNRAPCGKGLLDVVVHGCTSTVQTLRHDNIAALLALSPHQRRQCPVELIPRCSPANTPWAVPFVNLPAEHGLVKLDGSLGIVGVDLEMMTRGMGDSSS